MKKHLPLFIFIIFYLFYVLLSYRSFGATWDEQAVYERGKQLYKHLIDPNERSNNDLIDRGSDKSVWPTYNNSYATALFAFNKDQSYETYHLSNLLFATVLFISAYFFLYFKYKKPWLSILGPLFIVLNPRFFGDIAGNPKDISFAVLYFLSIFTIYFIPSVKNILLRVFILGILFAFTQSSRTLGFTIYFVLLIYDMFVWKYNFIKNKTHKNFIVFFCHESLYLLMIFICSNFFMLITWPYIGSNYFKNFFDVLATAKQFPWLGTVFFMGKNYLSQDIPRYYLFVWLMVGLPVFITVSSIGSIILLKKMWKKNEILFLAVLTIGINLSIYLITKPVIYNGIRHFSFLLPIFSLLAAIFIIELINANNNKIRYIFLVFVAANCLSVIISQVKLFPYQYLYFNELVGGLKGGSRYFVTDYWNASFKEAVSWLIENKIEKNKKYPVYFCGSSLSMLYYLTENMELVDSYYKADYAVCSEYTKEYKKIPGEVIYTVERDSVPLNFVIKINPNNQF